MCPKHTIKTLRLIACVCSLLHYVFLVSHLSEVQILIFHYCFLWLAQLFTIERNKINFLPVVNG